MLGIAGKLTVGLGAGFATASLLPGCGSGGRSTIDGSVIDGSPGGHPDGSTGGYPDASTGIYPDAPAGIYPDAPTGIYPDAY